MHYFKFSEESKETLVKAREELVIGAEAFLEGVKEEESSLLDDVLRMMKENLRKLVVLVDHVESYDKIKGFPCEMSVSLIISQLKVFIVIGQPVRV
jgi:hypothetical protein